MFTEPYLMPRLFFMIVFFMPCLNAQGYFAQLKHDFESGSTAPFVLHNERTQPTKFLALQNNYPFPAVVANAPVQTWLLQPAAFPKTVVLRNTGKTPGRTPVMNPTSKTENPVVQLSQDFIYKARTGEPTDAIVQQLQALTLPQLQLHLNSDATKKAFWINLYNGFTQHSLRDTPEQYKNRSRFFKGQQFEVAGTPMSLDAIEHGLLRRSKVKWGLGYLNHPFPSEWEKALRVDKVDYRIHFALNCGARSCPPIAFYRPETIEAQLDLAAKAYLGSETDYDPLKKLVQVPAILSWFRGDFGSKPGIRQMLKKYNIIPADAEPQIQFKKYDWTLTLNHYTNEIS